MKRINYNISSRFAAWKKCAFASLIIAAAVLNNQSASAQSAPAKTPPPAPVAPATVSAADVPAKFPGGMQGLIKFLSTNLKHPKGAVSGKVFATFTVKDDGSIEDIRIVRKLNPVNDAEVVRVLKLSPKWIPGTKDGEAVESEFTLPISFTEV